MAATLRRKRKLTRRQQQRRDAERVREQPGTLPGFRGEARLAGRPRPGTDVARQVEVGEIDRRREKATNHAEQIGAEVYIPKPLPVTLPNLRAVQTRPMNEDDEPNCMGYCRYVDPRDGDELWRLVKVTRVGERTCSIQFIDDGRKRGMVPHGCVQIVLVY